MIFNEEDIIVQYVKPLSEAEFSRCYDYIPKVGKSWWLDYSICVESDDNGVIPVDCKNVLGIRPCLYCAADRGDWWDDHRTLVSWKDWKENLGKTLNLYGNEWVVIGEGLLLSKDFVGNGIYLDKELDKPDGTPKYEYETERKILNYQKSDLCCYIDRWTEERKIPDMFREERKKKQISYEK